MNNNQLRNPIYFKDTINTRGTLISIELADLHIGVLDPEYQYNILIDQCINKLSNLNFDLLCLNGDTFDHKVTTTSKTASYTMKIVDKFIDLCRKKNATIILLAGTQMHDAGQLNLFYFYLEDPTIDIRIVEQVQFEYVKGSKILCIPELYNKGKEYYEYFLYQCGSYDSVRMHGTIKNSVYGKDKENLDSEREPVFSLDSFAFCNGPIISGHVHISKCYEKYMYYVGSPMRFQYGEEEDKGFMILLHNLDTREHYIHLEPIQSYRYDTINLDHMLQSDPKEIISYLQHLQQSGIDNIRVNFTKEESDIYPLLNGYYKNNNSIKIVIPDKSKKEILKASEESLQLYNQYEYITDPGLSEYDKLTRYINDNKGYEYISVQDLIEILQEVN